MKKVLSLAFISLTLVGCNGNSDDEQPCCEITLPVIVPAIRVNLFDINEQALNACDAILTITNSSGTEVVYGSAFNNCEEEFSLDGGFNLEEHDFLIEKAGFVNQEFSNISPIETRCAYETIEIDVFLEAN